MQTQLTFENGQYQIPEQWRRLLWIREFSNYPDPDHATFVDEYDWSYKDEKGLIYKYINHVEGSQRLEQVGRKVNRRTSPKPQSYYLFASVAVYLLNHPEYIRDVRAKGGLHGGFIVNYANSIPVNELLPPPFNDTVEPLVKKLKEKKHILPVTFASLFARVFNAYSGVQEEHKILTEPREAKLSVCPNPDCSCAFEQLSRDFWLPTDAEYLNKIAEARQQIDNRVHRDMTGQPLLAVI
tara:strand:+ start:309 stop:1025 length:717 start_codon:yes stop_codon:yes gene_type:complete